MERDGSRIACRLFVNEYKLHKRAIYRKTPNSRLRVASDELWLASCTIHHANYVRRSADGLKVGGH